MKENYYGQVTLKEFQQEAVHIALQNLWTHNISFFANRSNGFITHQMPK